MQSSYRSFHIRSRCNITCQQTSQYSLRGDLHSQQQSRPYRAHSLGSNQKTGAYSTKKQKTTRNLEKRPSIWSEGNSNQLFSRNELMDLQKRIEMTQAQTPALPFPQHSASGCNLIIHPKHV